MAKRNPLYSEEVRAVTNRLMRKMASLRRRKKTASRTRRALIEAAINGLKILKRDVVQDCQQCPGPPPGGRRHHRQGRGYRG